MQNYIKIIDTGTTFDIPEIKKNPIIKHEADNRTWRGITIIATDAEAKAAFIDGVNISRFYESEEDILDGEGIPTGETQIVLHEEPMSKWCVATGGCIVDTLDGNVVVYMGAKTNEEISEEALLASQQALSDLLVQIIGGVL